VTRRRWTVETLARASELDIDQTLVALWSEGIEYPLDPNARIRPEDSRAAERAVGMAGGRVTRVAFWQDELGLNREQITGLLNELGVRLAPNASTLPKGAVRKIRAHYGLSVSVLAREADDAPSDVLEEAPPFTWVAPGTHRDCIHLTVDEIKQVHEQLTVDFALTDDPISPPGVKYPDLLESAATRPGTGYGSAKKYPTVESAAAALLHSLVHNHPFHNGNKRTALVATLVVLDRHDLIVDSNQDELYKFMVRVGAHDLLPSGYRYDLVADREVERIAKWIKQRSHSIRREERAVTWRELQKKLKQRECEVLVDKGDRYLITRQVPGRWRLIGGRRMRTLETHYINTGDGRDVPRKIIKKMRTALQLDPEHGVDADVFYGGVKGPDYFILEYQKVLRRLARV
jgi:death-on-curing family protein